MKFSEIELPSNRKFGLFFTAVFSIACAYFAYKGMNVLASILGGLAIVFVVLSLTKPGLLLPLNKLWMGLGFVLGMIVSPIVLGLIFFVIFTPVGLMMRLFGRDELRMKPDPAKSHWKTRDDDAAAVNSFKTQF